MLSLELVETAPRRMSSTPRGKGRGWLAYIMYFLSHFQGLEGWTLEGEAIIVLFHLYLCNFWLRKTRVLQSSLGFLWTHVLMVCFLNVLVSFVM